LLLLVGIVAASGVGTLAYGYWTESGAGTGGATAGTTSALTVNQTNSVTGLYPGGPAKALSGNFDNPNASSVTLSTITAVVSSVSGGAGPGCSSADFAIAGPGTVGGGGVVPNGNGQGSWSGLTIRMVNAATNQDDCKGASPVITYTAS
jgi:hypothetical protein